MYVAISALSFKVFWLVRYKIPSIYAKPNVIVDLGIGVVCRFRHVRHPNGFAAVACRDIFQEPENQFMVARHGISPLPHLFADHTYKRLDGSGFPDVAPLVAAGIHRDRDANSQSKASASPPRSSERSASSRQAFARLSSLSAVSKSAFLALCRCPISTGPLMSPHFVEVHIHNTGNSRNRQRL